MHGGIGSCRWPASRRRYADSSSDSRNAFAMRSKVRIEGCTSLPCSSHVYQDGLTPASLATSSRRKPRTRRRPSVVAPAPSGGNASLRDRRSWLISNRLSSGLIQIPMAFQEIGPRPRESLSPLSQGTHPGAGEHESRKGHPLLQEDPRQGVEWAGERLGHHELLAMTAALGGKGEARECDAAERQGPLSPDESGEEGDIAEQREWDENDVQEQIAARLVGARIGLPLHAKQRRNAHRGNLERVVQY